MGDHVCVSGQYVTPRRPRARAGATVRVTRHLGIVLLGVAAFGYLGWAVEFVLPTGLPLADSYVIELSADGRPYQGLFRAFDLVTGFAALAASPLLARVVPAQIMPRLTIATVAVFGLVMLLRGLLTLDCAPSVDAACSGGDAHSAAHHASWALAVATSVLYLFGVATAERWFCRGFWRNTLRCAFVLGGGCGAAILVLDWWGGGQLVGIVVRVQLVVHAAVLLVGAAYLGTLSRRRPARPSPSPSPP